LYLHAYRIWAIRCPPLVFVTVCISQKAVTVSLFSCIYNSHRRLGSWRHLPHTPAVITILNVSV
ncbi:MAG: hypothetical protein NC548_57465, partial [Lachnospiraceae bacterium]|nr:hypothetical protein [Lachnospiraceae bacterium]